MCQTLIDPGSRLLQIRAAPARPGGQRQLRDLALRLVPAPAALDEQRGGLLRHAREHTSAARPPQQAREFLTVCAGGIPARRPALWSHSRFRGRALGFRQCQRLPANLLRHRAVAHRAHRARPAVSRLHGVRFLAGAAPGAQQPAGPGPRAVPARGQGRRNHASIRSRWCSRPGISRSRTRTARSCSASSGSCSTSTSPRSGKSAPASRPWSSTSPMRACCCARTARSTWPTWRNPRMSSRPSEDDEEPVGVFIDRLSVATGRVAFEDRARATPFATEFRPITFELRDFSTGGESGNAYSLHGASLGGERFAWSGNFALEPLTSSGKFEVSALKATTIWSYLREGAALRIHQGHAGSQRRIFLRGERRRAVCGFDIHKIGVTDFGMRPPGKDYDYIEVASLALEETEVAVRTRRVNIGRVRLDGGAVRAARDAAGNINLTEFAAKRRPRSPRPMRRAGAGRAAGTTSARPDWVVAAPDIAITGVRVDFEDQLVQARGELCAQSGRRSTSPDSPPRPRAPSSSRPRPRARRPAISSSRRSPASTPTRTPRTWKSANSTSPRCSPICPPTRRSRCAAAG